MKSAIVIPARYHSSRFPGKPLAIIAGKTMLRRVCEIALSAADRIGEVEVLVATEDERIMTHATEIGVRALMTPQHCKTGSDRILAAVEQLAEPPEQSAIQ